MIRSHDIICILCTCHYFFSWLLRLQNIVNRIISHLRLIILCYDLGLMLHLTPYTNTAVPGIHTKQHIRARRQQHDNNIRFS